MIAILVLPSTRASLNEKDDIVPEKNNAPVEFANKIMRGLEGLVTKVKKDHRASTIQTEAVAATPIPICQGSMCGGTPDNPTGLCNLPIGSCGDYTAPGVYIVTDTSWAKDPTYQCNCYGCPGCTGLLFVQPLFTG